MTIVDAFSALVAGTALLVLFYGPWQNLCTDFARQVLFEKRDQIFDLALKGKLDFSSDSYRQIRVSIEQMIRFAHELSLVRYVINSALVASSDRKVGKSSLRLAIEEISDPDTKREVERAVSDAYRAIVLMMSFKSGLVVVLLPLVVIATLCRFEFWQSTGEKAQVEAEFAYGNLSRAA